VDGMAHVTVPVLSSDEADDTLRCGLAGPMRVALIDSLALTRDCLSLAFASALPNLLIIPFASAQECISASASASEVILYHSHEDIAPGSPVLRTVKLLCAALPHIPVAVLSSHACAVEPRHLRATVAAGARGFIPSTSTNIQLATAAIRLVREGGSFAPVNLLASDKRDRVETAESIESKQLTPRENEILSRLRRGQPNKIIAYELSLTESTVKVHIRNIMRKMGAINRTEAVYKSQQLWRDAGLEP
jgi:DNA-binding NarL/FixJ family response regulator